MTKILKLEMKGFKSFAKKTVVPLGDGFNVVLGPNGSGKSNIIDALCFVLGKLSSKGMRADKTAELIYNGGKSKKPASEASVSIVFDNSDKTFPLEAAEIIVGRTVKKNGSSVYRINDRRCTRLQVVELLSHAKVDPEGYNIILQGDINKFVEMSNNERRGIIEEISGISLYEEKKHKALNELKKVDIKLNAVDIRLEERKIYLDGLRKDRDQAVKFRDVKNKEDRIQATLLHLNIKQLNSNLKRIQTKQDKLDEEIKGLKQREAQSREETETTREEIAELTQKIERGGAVKEQELFQQREMLSVEIVKQEERQRTCKEEMEKLLKRKEGMSQELQTSENKVKRMEAAVEKLKQEHKAAKTEVERMETEIQRFREAHGVEDIASIEELLTTLDADLDERREAVNVLRESQQGTLLKKERAETRLNTFGERQSKVKQVKAEHKVEMQELGEKRKCFKKLISGLNTFTTNSSSTAAKIGNLRESLLKKKEELGKQRIAQAAVKERTAASISVKRILEERNRIKGIHGTVSELAKVPSQYALALEVAAGRRLKNIVVDDDIVAAVCIKYLKTNKLGVATFLPLNKIRAHQLRPELRKLAKANGAIGFAVELVNHPSRYRKVFQYVFGTTLVVENIEVMRRIGIGATRMVTLEGDLAETSGAMSGGHRTRRPGTGFSTTEGGKHLTRLEGEVSKLESEIAVLEGDKIELQEKVDTMRAEKASLEGEIRAAEKKLHLEESDLDSDKEQRLLIEADLDLYDRALKEVEGKIRVANSELAEMKTKRDQLRQKTRGLKEPRLVAELNSFTMTREEQKTKAENIMIEIRTKELQVNDILKPELEKLRKLIGDSTKEYNDYDEESVGLKEELKDNRDIQAKHKVALEEFFKKNKKLLARRDELQTTLGDLRASTGKLEGELKAREEQDNEATIKSAEVKSQLAGLEKDFERYEGVPLLEEKKSRRALQGELDRFEEMMADMGSINMKALELYDTVEKEFNDLTGKRVILHEEKYKVHSLMEEIEGKKKKLFIDTFKLVSKNFHRIFKELAPKGEVWLLIENEESPLDDGIEIKARMSEKRALPIRSLSGGEKTLTALAFIFAIQEFEPASFYIMDEVDAALDKHNSEKFGKLLGKYSKTAQYIIVSHNDYVLGEADLLFGISMNAEGVSKITSLKV